MIGSKKALAFIKQNKYIIVAIVFFLVYRTFFTWLLFHGRSVPPEPDDSYFYLSAAKNFPQISNFEDFRLFYFSAWIRLLALFIGNNLELAYKLNFYIGPLIMIYPLYFFISKLSQKKLEVAFLVFIITLFSGSGQYHGFYWVVPSFYHLALYFIILGLLISDKKENPLKLFLVTAIFIFSHPTSFFTSMIFYFYIFLIFFFDKKLFKISLQKIIIVFISTIFAYSIFFLIGRSLQTGNSPESFDNIMLYAKSFFHNGPITFSIIWKEYFSIFTLNIAIFLISMAVLVTNFLHHRKAFYLFVASSALVIIALFIPYGARTLAYLWPLTFLLISFFFIDIYKYLRTTSYKWLILLPLIIFFILTTSFNLIYVKSVNASKDYEWDRSCPKTMNSHTIFFKSLEGKYAFTVFSNNSTNYYFLSDKNLKENIEDGNLIVLTGRLKYTQENLTKTEQLLAKNVTRRETVVFKKTPDDSWTQQPVNEENINQLLNNLGFKYNLSQDCGYYKVYKISKI